MATRPRHPSEAISSTISTAASSMKGRTKPHPSMTQPQSAALGPVPTGTSSEHNAMAEPARPTGARLITIAVAAGLAAA